MNQERWSFATLVGLAALLCLTVVLRVSGLGFAPAYDEVFHILAARSWLENGTFCIADCLREYGRGAPFTYLVTGSFALFGESLVTARIPSVVVGTLLVFGVFFWMRREVSSPAAWIAAGLCAVAPELIGWSQTARFYAMQALFVWCGAGLFYLAVVGERWRFRATAAVLSIACFAVAREVQITTLIPVAAVGLWFAGWLFAHRSRFAPRIRWLAIGGAAVVGALIVAWQWPTLELYWQRYRSETNLIHLAEVDNPFFYHAWFKWMYAYLYALFPIAVVLAVVKRPRPALFLTVVFTVAFIAHSFGGFKGDRLILYAFPYFFGVWGIALADIVPALDKHLRAGVGRLRFVASERRASIVVTTSVAAALAFAALNTGALQTTLRLATVDGDDWWSAPWYRGHTNWDSVRPQLVPLADTVDVVVSSAMLRTLYYFGRTDAGISRTALFVPGDDGGLHDEFWRDWRTGTPVISTPQSVEQVIRCHASGLILVEAGHWRLPAVVPPETADAIETLSDEIPLPRGSRARAFTWRNPPDETATDCEVKLGRGSVDQVNSAGAGSTVHRFGAQQ